ncbi:MAG: PAS domain S-box protein [Phycisphaerae bacterium]|nr:PAS domain S-box protein [Phycisphaerae bacterium]
MNRKQDDKQEHTDVEARHDIRNYLDTVIQTSYDGIAVVDSEGRFEFCNEAFFRISGWPREELLGHNFIKVIAPDFHEFILERWKEVQAGKGAPHEVDIIQKDGSRRSMLVSHRHMAIAGQRKYCVVAKDITESKQAREALRFLGLITEQVSDAILTTNLDFEISYINRSFESLFGYSREEILGLSPGILNAEPDAERIQSDIYKTVSSGGVWRGELLNRRKDGGTFPCEMTIFPLVDDEGNAFAYAGNQRDITERKQIEEALTRYHALLEEMVHMRTRELTEAQVTLRRVHRRLLNAGEAERRRLAGELHDSVGQKLVAMSLGIRQTIMGCEDSAGHEAEIQALQNVGQQCIETIQEIRDICYGLYPPMLELTGLAPALRQLGRSCEPAVSFHFQCDNSLGKARFDSEQEIALFRMAQEAVSNALKHSRATNISISLEKRADTLTMAIRDDGVGFDTTSQLGQGLGLRSMAERARAVGGTIDITSHPGRTSIEVTLPVKHPKTPKI